MKCLCRFCLVLMAIWLAAGCSRLPALRPVPGSATDTIQGACRAVFPQGKWQFTHVIEAFTPEGGEHQLLGVTVVDVPRQALTCALMTVEGLVLFQARMDPALRVERALPPFDRKGFADGMLADIRLIFLEPSAASVATGLLPESPSARSPVCRYTGKKGQVTDVMPGPGQRWRIARYGPRGRLLRMVAADLVSGKGFPGRLELRAPGAAGYTLKMKLIDAVRLDD